MLDEVLRQIDQRSHFLLTSHARPDGDAIGSALACGQILRLLGKRAEVVLHDPVPRIYQPLPFADRVVQADRVNGRYEAAILLECDSVQRTRLEGLRAATGYIRRELTEQLHLRRAPELLFILDRSHLYEARIEELLGRTKKRGNAESKRRA